MKRDPKGHYKAVQEGTLTGFIGIDDQVPYEPPESADLVLDTESHGLEECAKELVELLIGKAAVH
jgi:bifunctional enzyme CysN/CysC